MAFTAARELAQAVRLAPKNVDALCDLAAADQQIQSFKGAEDAYRRAIRLSPRLVRGYVGVGAVYTSMGLRAEAEKALTHALELSPNDSTTLVTLAGARLESAGSGAELAAVGSLPERAVGSDPT